MPGRIYNVRMTQSDFMAEAVNEALKALNTNDVPIGCIAVKDGMIIARAHNEKEKRQDATAHAELLCLMKAAKKAGTWRLEDVDIYTTLEPCAMCAGAMVLARIRTVIIGTKDPKAGAAGSVMNIIRSKKLNHRIKILFAKGEDRDRCSCLLKQFFSRLRASSRV